MPTPTHPLNIMSLLESQVGASRLETEARKLTKLTSSYVRYLRMCAKGELPYRHSRIANYRKTIKEAHDSLTTNLIDFETCTSSLTEVSFNKPQD